MWDTYLVAGIIIIITLVTLVEATGREGGRLSRGPSMACGDRGDQRDRREERTNQKKRTIFGQLTGGKGAGAGPLGRKKCGREKNEQGRNQEEQQKGKECADRVAGLARKGEGSKKSRGQKKSKAPRECRRD
jgi:hypothetical protein